MRDLVFGGLWALMLPALVLSPTIGVLIWVWTALLSPNELLYGVMAGVPFNKVVAALTIACLAFSKESKAPYADAIVVLMLLFALAATGSWLTSIVDTAEGTDLYFKVLKEVTLAIAITAVITTRHRMHLLVLTVCIGFGFIGVKEGLIFLLTAGGHKVDGVLSIGDNNSLATALLMLSPLLYYASRQAAVRIIRIGLLTAMVLCLVTVVATYSRGGFVGLLVLAAFMVKNSRSRVSTFLMVALAGVLIYALAPAAWFERLDTINDASSDYSFMGRVMAWKASWLIAVDNPVFGGGLHAVQRFAVWAAYRIRLGELSWIPDVGDDSFPRAAHSSYFEVLGDLGFTGLALFLAMLAVAFWQCRYIYRTARLHPDLAWAADLGRMMQVSLAIYVVTTVALSMAYFEFFYVMLAMISRTRRIVQETIAAEAGALRRETPRARRAVQPASGAVRPQPAYTRQPDQG